MVDGFPAWHQGVGPHDRGAARHARQIGCSICSSVWREILTDPAVMAEGAKTQRPLKYEEPAKLQQTVRDLLQTLPANKLNDVNEVLLKKYSS